MSVSVPRDDPAMAARVLGLCLAEHRGATVVRVGSHLHVLRPLCRDEWHLASAPGSRCPACGEVAGS